MKPSSTAGDAASASATAEASSSSSGPSTSASASTSAAAGDATHYIAKRVLRGSAVLHVAEGCFRSPDSADVVLAKETSLELVSVGDDGVLQSICEQDMFGIIKDIGVLQWHSRHVGLIPQIEHKDLLVVLSDSGKLSLLYFCSEMHRFFAIANMELSKPGNLRHHLGRNLAIDQENMKKGTSPSGGESYYFGTENKLRIFPPNTYKFKPRDHIILDNVQECILDNFWYQYNNKREDKGYMLAILNSLAEYFNIINRKMQPREVPSNIEKKPIYVIYVGTAPGVYITYESIVSQQIEMQREGKGKPSWKKYLDIDQALSYARDILGINYFIEPIAKEYIQNYKIKEAKASASGTNMQEASSSRTPTYKDVVKKEISNEDFIEQKIKVRLNSIIPQIKNNIKEEVLQKVRKEINENIQIINQDYEENIRKDYEEYIKKDYDAKMNAHISDEDINDLLDDNMMDDPVGGQPSE